ncbi:hypothetical protein N9W34_06090, partial [Rickettsiales bacterium]|nr:hypothetical protein [Rickettsiales bacterium]
SVVMPMVRKFCNDNNFRFSILEKIAGECYVQLVSSKENSPDNSKLSFIGKGAGPSALNMAIIRAVIAASESKIKK